MTKGAVASLTRGLARELGPRGITVNNVQPGPIATDMNPDAGEFAELAKQVMALGHYGHPRDIAGVVSYLAGPDSASSPAPTGTWTVDSPYSGLSAAVAQTGRLAVQRVAIDRDRQRLGVRQRERCLGHGRRYAADVVMSRRWVTGERRIVEFVDVLWVGAVLPSGHRKPSVLFVVRAHMPPVSLASPPQFRLPAPRRGGQSGRVKGVDALDHLVGRRGTRQPKGRARDNNGGIKDSLKSGTVGVRGRRCCASSRLPP